MRLITHARLITRLVAITLSFFALPSTYDARADNFYVNRAIEFIVAGNAGGDVPLNVENCGSGLASFDDYAAFDVSSSPKWLA